MSICFQGNADEAAAYALAHGMTVQGGPFISEEACNATCGELSSAWWCIDGECLFGYFSDEDTFEQEGEDPIDSSELDVSGPFEDEETCLGECGEEPPAGPTYHWTFHEGTGTTVEDVIAGNDASFSGSPTGWSSDYPVGSGFSLEIDANGGLSIPAFVDTSAPFTFFIRAKLKSSNTPNRLLWSGDDTGATHQIFSIFRQGLDKDKGQRE